MKTDVYQRITDQIIAALEDGVKPWRQPWSCGGEVTGARPLRHNGEAYRGINVLILWLSARSGGHTSPTWMTFNQAKSYGGMVRKGERGTKIVFVKRYDREVDDGAGGTKTEQIPVYREYAVFNVCQIDDLPARFLPDEADEEPVKTEAERLPELEGFFERVGAERIWGRRACYSPTQDVICMPPADTFERATAYYATLAHEHVHWTKAEKRCSRDFGAKRWGDDGYAVEELVAEMGAAFLGADLDLEPIEMPQHASYIDHWLKVLKRDKRAIFTAASYAEKAVAFLHEAAANEDKLEEAA